MPLYCGPTCPTLTTALKLLYYHVSISSNENKMSTNLETNTSNVFKSVYYVPYILQSTSNSLFLYLILDLNIYTFFQ